MKKTFVLFVLFVLPVVAYLFFATGVNNFGKLPVLQENVTNISTIDSGKTFTDKISILVFLGDNVSDKKGLIFNLNQKIYKRFAEFTDFQFVVLVTPNQEKVIEDLKYEIGKLTDTDKWNFVTASPSQIQTLFSSLGTKEGLSKDYGTSLVFIIDKEGNLRGRTDDEDEGVKYGFDATSVAELTNKMIDDVRIILAEYRLALKKNNATRVK